MKKWIHAFRWDLLREWRYNIIAVALVVTAIYVALIRLLPLTEVMSGKLLVFFIFNDPTALGMLFVGSLILFERADRTLYALAITPISTQTYLWSKNLTLTAIAIVCSLIMAYLGHGVSIRPLFLIAGVGLSSLLFTFIGMAVVASCRTFNEYILKVAAVLIPTALPFLNFFELTDTYWWYIVPTQASLKLMEASFYPVSNVDIWYSLLYLLLWVFISNVWAKRAFERQVSKGF
jgi:fluoroquinolone transport system permease protein